MQNDKPKEPTSPKVKQQFHRLNIFVCEKTDDKQYTNHQHINHKEHQRSQKPFYFLFMFQSPITPSENENPYDINLS